MREKVSEDSLIRLRRHLPLLAVAIFWLLSVVVAVPAFGAVEGWPEGQAGIGWEEGAEAPTLVSTANRRDCFAAPTANRRDCSAAPTVNRRDCSAAPKAGLPSGDVWLDPAELRFSQRTAGGGGGSQTLRESLSRGWDVKGRAIGSVIERPNGSGGCAAAERCGSC
jgi:hypothetical protein